MSQVPVIIPLVVSGAFLGSVWPNKELKAVRKKAVIAATVSGVLNAVHGLLLGLFRSAGSSQTNNHVGFVVASGLTGFLVVLTVYFSALGMIWYLRRKQVESDSESEQ